MYIMHGCVSAFDIRIQSQYHIVSRRTGNNRRKLHTYLYYWYTSTCVNSITVFSVSTKGIFALVQSYVALICVYNIIYLVKMYIIINVMCIGILESYKSRFRFETHTADYHVSRNVALQSTGTVFHVYTVYECMCNLFAYVQYVYRCIHLVYRLKKKMGSYLVNVYIYIYTYFM